MGESSCSVLLLQGASEGVMPVCKTNWFGSMRHEALKYTTPLRARAQDTAAELARKWVQSKKDLFIQKMTEKTVFFLKRRGIWYKQTKKSQQKDLKRARILHVDKDNKKSVWAGNFVGSIFFNIFGNPLKFDKKRRKIENKRFTKIHPVLCKSLKIYILVILKKF